MKHISIEELALQRDRYAHLTDTEFRFMLQQLDGRQRTRDKLPTFAGIDDWWYPVRLSCEQCSSELTAQYKLHIIRSLGTYNSLIDLTGGYGVDTYFMSEDVIEAHYVERDEALCRIVQHNFSLHRPHVRIHNTRAEDFLSDYPSLEDALVYIDPARRDGHGGKVFRIEDCEPNILSLLPYLKRAKALVIKLSPMLDISAALRSLAIPLSVHIVAVKNEVKEVLLVGSGCNTIQAINISSTYDSAGYAGETFVFTQDEERDARCELYSSNDAHLLERGSYIYEPNSAILKAGAFKLVGQCYGLYKMAPHTHLYMSDTLVSNFPGRIWQIVESQIKDCHDIRASIMTRNYPLSPDALRKKLRMKESDSHTLIGARLADKPTLFLCQKI